MSVHFQILLVNRPLAKVGEAIACCGDEIGSGDRFFNRTYATGTYRRVRQ
jgi:hypothetical protein